MICTVIYYLETSKIPHIQTFDGENKAVEFINTEGDAIQNAQIFVNVGEVRVYKEKFDELYDITMKRAFSNEKNDKREVQELI